MHMLAPQVELDLILLLLTLATLAIGFLTCSLLDRLHASRSALRSCEAHRSWTLHGGRTH